MESDQKPICIWLDDERDPATRLNVPHMDVIWVKDYWEFKKALKENVQAGRTIGRIHFDWWLGSYEHNGMDCVLHVLEMTEDGFLTDHPAIHMRSHSSNRECAFEISTVIKEIHELTGRPTSR